MTAADVLVLLLFAAQLAASLCLALKYGAVAWLLGFAMMWSVILIDGIGKGWLQ